MHFRQIAQLPYATVRRRRGQVGVRGCASAAVHRGRESDSRARNLVEQRTGRQSRIGWLLWRPRNAIFVQGPYRPCSGSAAPAGSEGGPDGTAGGCGAVRNAVFRRRYGSGVGRDGRAVGLFHSSVEQEADPVAPVAGNRQGGSLGQRARSAEREHHDMPRLPPGACPGGGPVRVDGPYGGGGRASPLHWGWMPGEGRSLASARARLGAPRSPRDGRRRT